MGQQRQPPPDPLVQGTFGGHWVLIIHGGLWRDPKITARNGLHAAHELLQLDGVHGVFSVDYQLSPKVRHPQHLHDVYDKVKQIHREYQFEELSVVGHSVGAFIGAQLVSQCEFSFKFKYKHFIALAGFYELDDFALENPSWAHCLVEAMGDPKEWKDAQPNWDLVAQRTNLVLVHSNQDELMSKRHLAKGQELGKCETIYVDGGTHDDFFEKFELIETYRRIFSMYP